MSQTTENSKTNKFENLLGETDPRIDRESKEKLSVLVLVCSLISRSLATWLLV